MKGGLLLDVVIGQRPSILELLPGEDKTLLIRRDSFLILNLGLDVVDRVRWFDIQRDRLSRESLDEDLHSSTKTEDQMEGGLLLNVVIGQRASILELLPGEDKTLLIRRDSFLILNFGLDVVNRVRWFDIQRDRLSRESLDEDLHSSTKTEDQM